MAKNLIIFAVAILALGACEGPGGAQAQTRKVNAAAHRKSRTRSAVLQQQGMEAILTDQSLWGEKFSSLLASLPAFAGAGESTVWVFPDRVVGGNKYRSKDEAERQVKNLSENLKKSAMPRSDKLRTYMASGVTPLKPTAILFRDDRTYRVAAEGGPFLQPGLTIDDVRKRLGKEERVTTELLDDGTDRRPVGLTLHFYAGGAIAFVESDHSVKIGSVDRVLLDASKISATLF